MGRESPRGSYYRTAPSWRKKKERKGVSHSDRDLMYGDEGGGEGTMPAASGLIAPLPLFPLVDGAAQTIPSPERNGPRRKGRAATDRCLHVYHAHCRYKKTFPYISMLLF